MVSSSCSDISLISSHITSAQASGLEASKVSSRLLISGGFFFISLFLAQASAAQKGSKASVAQKAPKVTAAAAPAKGTKASSAQKKTKGSAAQKEKVSSIVFNMSLNLAHIIYFCSEQGGPGRREERGKYFFPILLSQNLMQVDFQACFALADCLSSVLIFF